MTDKQTPHDDIGRAYASHRAAKITDCSFRYASPSLWNQLPGSFLQPHHSPVMSRHTSSFISVIITTVIIHHSFTPGSKPTFSTNPSHLNNFYPGLPSRPWDRTYHASRFIFRSFSSLIFLFVPCGGLSWLRISF